MRSLKKLAVAVALVLALGLTALADCPVPGVMDGPPCAAAQTLPDDSIPNDSTESAIKGTSTVVSDSPSVELPSLAEIALNVLMLF